MLTALTHIPSPHLSRCELTYLASKPIDFDKALRQHQAYVDMLQRCGVRVIVLEANRDLPDSVFVEDTALVLDEIAVMTPMGVASRQAESAAVETALAPFRPIARIRPPAKLEGGDVLRMGRHLYVGLSTRTNKAGLQALAEIVRPHGYRVSSVEVTGGLHLKTACTALDAHTVLINPAWVEAAPFEGLEQIIVPPNEPFAANILRIDGTIGMHAGFEGTRRLAEARGYRVAVADISEFLKAEAGLTCMSLLFDGAWPQGDQGL
jgi:dimethylargininase